MTRSPRRLGKQVREAVGEHVRDLPVQATRLAMFGVGRALLLSDRVTKDYKELRGSGPKPVLGRLRNDVQHLAGKAVNRVTERVTGTGEPAPARTAPENAAASSPDIPVARPPAKASGAAVTEPEIVVGKPAPAVEAQKPATGPATRPTPPADAPAATSEAPARATSKPASRATSKTAPKATSKAPAKAAPKAAAKAAAKGTPKTTPKATSKAGIAAESLPVPDYDQATLPSLRGRLRNLSIEQIRQLRAYEREHAARAEVLRMFENRIAKLENGV